ncbi:MAG: hypothetical protein EA339_02010 [Rhodobacteraceae bacterium]|nr:MAG: hypothetical protein EA339_02010 [Paracoccaceae bacterium]
MQTLIPGLETLIRPRLLVVAARHGLADYHRATLLPRLLGLPIGRKLPAPADALKLLLARERILEQARRHHDASWRAADHVAVIMAILHEASEINQIDTADLPELAVLRRSPH